MKGPLNWGLICTARINQALIPAIRASGRCELAAVASRDAARAEAYAREQSIPRAHGGYQALLDDPGIDVVYNALPNHLHCEWTVRAADAGKHVLCEKPLALTAEEVDRIAAAAERNGVVVFEAFMYRHHPQTLEAQALVRRGAIGDLRLVRGSFSFVLGNPGDVRFDPSMGGGALWDVGCYPVSFCRAIAGADPAEAFGRQVCGESGVDLDFVGQLSFAGGVLGQFDCSFRSQFRWGAEVVGSEGVLCIQSPWKPGGDGPPGIRLRRGDDEEWVAVESVDAYLCEVEAMADCVLEGADPVLPLSDSRGNVATLNALYRSARTGEAVLLGRQHSTGQST